MDSLSLSDDRIEVPSGGSLRGTVRVPPSKSVTHRMLALALLGGRSLEVERPLDADDTRRTRAALVAVGWTVEGRGPVIRLTPPVAPPAGASIDCGNAGTVVRLLTGVLVALPGRWRLDGTPRMRERPLGPLLAALRSLGARIDCPLNEGFPPIEIHGGSLAGGVVRLAAGESSQYVSALLLAALAANEPIEIEVTELSSRPYVDLTVEAIRRFGGRVEVEENRYRVEPGMTPPPRVAVDGDFSAAAYWAAGAVLSDGEVTIEGLEPTSAQGDRSFFDLLVRMGAAVDWSEAGVTVRGGSRLEGIEADLCDMPDQVPTLAALAPFAAGTTRIRNVRHLRLKESDRLAAMRSELERIGARVVEHDDGLEIPGVWNEAAAPRDPVTVDSWDDHRIAMSMAIAALRRSNVSVGRPGVVAKSYPDFWLAFDRLLSAER